MSRVLPKSDRVDDCSASASTGTLTATGGRRFATRSWGWASALLWDAEVFPYVWCWASYGGSFGYPHYGRVMNLAIEPFTSPIAPLHELVVGRPTEVRWLNQDEALATSLRFLFLIEVDEPFAGRADDAPPPNQVVIGGGRQRPGRDHGWHRQSDRIRRACLGRRHRRCAFSTAAGPPSHPSLK